MIPLDGVNLLNFSKSIYIGISFGTARIGNDFWLFVTISGSRSGLSLLLNVEQYEYMRGPQNVAGIKVIFTDRKGK